MSRFLAISSEHLTAEISPIGAALARLWLTGHDTSLVLGLPSPQDYARSAQYIGVIVGPVAGRVAGGRVALHGTQFQMQCNEGPNCLHSGAQGVSHQTWSVAQHTQHSLRLCLHLPDGACGLPGSRNITVEYSVDGTALTVTITTHTDTDTPVNLTSHAYWTLDGTGDLGTHHLRLATTCMLETDTGLIPTGQIIDTTGTDFDFSKPRSPVAGAPIDRCFSVPTPEPRKLQPALFLHSTLSGIGLEVQTNQSGMVLYTGAGLPNLPAPPKTPKIGPFSALAIETQGWPDAMHHPHFPSIILPADETLSQITRFNLEMPQD